MVTIILPKDWENWADMVTADKAMLEITKTRQFVFGSLTNNIYFTQPATNEECIYFQQIVSAQTVLIYNLELTYFCDVERSAICTIVL